MTEEGGRKPPVHVSYSAINTWLRCGKQYQLSRIIGVPEVPAWYLIGGRAVHRATEEYDRWLESQ